MPCLVEPGSLAASRDIATHAMVHNGLGNLHRANCFRCCHPKPEEVLCCVSNACCFQWCVEKYGKVMMCERSWPWHQQTSVVGTLSDVVTATPPHIRLLPRFVHQIGSLRDRSVALAKVTGQRGKRLSNYWYPSASPD